ncbi:HNH endonuclease signature motif containing protein, partial [Streptomyces lushanensis]|uniref:HNH endonuclease signature motif containing protein n=1 Tax=Streptomyces lushanensis TaxID=1434255 RepID=UPI000A821512
AGAGLNLPAKFDLKGIIQLLASMLGLTWANIRARITRKGVPEQAMAAAEQAVPVAQSLQKEGPAGAVEHIKASVGDLKTTILQKLTSYLIPTVLTAGIAWIVSLLTPASAFVRAVKGIIDIVTFIVTRGAELIGFVNSVLDAVIAIANGGQGGVPALIEGALAASIPLLIGFLAALLGIGGLANKVKQVFTAVARPVNKAIDKIVDFIVKKGKALWSKLKPQKKDKRSPQEQERALDAALRDARSLVKPKSDVSDIEGRLPAISRRHKLSSLTLVVDQDTPEQKTIHFEAVINPKKQSPPDKITGGGPGLYKAQKTGPNAFTGKFSDLLPAAWSRYDGLRAVDAHPGNAFLKRADSNVPRPTGAYSVPSGNTGGAVFTDTWRTELLRQKDIEKAKLVQAHPSWTQPGEKHLAENGAKLAVEQQHGMGWEDLRLAQGRWEEHHIKPVNWGGGNDLSNLIFIRSGQHSPITTFFENWLKPEIMKDIP